SPRLRLEHPAREECRPGHPHEAPDNDRSSLVQPGPEGHQQCNEAGQAGLEHQNAVRDPTAPTHSDSPRAKTRNYIGRGVAGQLNLGAVGATLSSRTAVGTRSGFAAIGPLPRQERSHGGWGYLMWPRMPSSSSSEWYSITSL